MNKTEPEIWYRYEDVTYAGGVNEDGDWNGNTTLKVELREFVVLKHTKHGVWLAPSFGDYKTLGFIGSERRFVLNRSIKRFACPTIELATESFIARKTRQVSIYEKRAGTARAAIHLIIQMQKYKGSSAGAVWGTGEREEAEMDPGG